MPDELREKLAAALQAKAKLPTCVHDRMRIQVLARAHRLVITGASKYTIIKALSSMADRGGPDLQELIKEIGEMDEWVQWSGKMATQSH